MDIMRPWEPLDQTLGVVPFLLDDYGFCFYILLDQYLKKASMCVCFSVVR